MKILFFLFLPIFAQAQIPTLNPDSTYTDKGHKTGVLLVTDAAYFPKLASTDTLEYARFDIDGKLVKRKITAGTSTTGWSLTGNAGTDTTVNFIGTTDANSFVIKQNNKPAIRLLPNFNTAIGSGIIGTGVTYSLSAGYLSEANGDISTAFGRSKANGANSFAAGYLSMANGTHSIAMGNQNSAATSAVALGSANTAQTSSVAIGNDAIASTGSIAVGNQINAIGLYSTVFGKNTVSQAYNSTVLGAFNDTTTVTNATSSSVTDKIFEVGNGSFNVNTTVTTRSNAITVLRNGSTGLGTVLPASSSLLDLTSTTKGFLTPRMTITQRNAIVSPATGLQVYNTSTNQNNFYNGTTWLSLIDNGSGWNLNGNAGTSSSTNFIGTADAKEFVLKANNIKSLSIDTVGSVMFETQLRNSPVNYGYNSPIFIRTKNATAHAITLSKGGYSDLNTLRFISNDGSSAFTLGQGIIGDEGNLDFIIGRNYLSAAWTQSLRVSGSTGNVVINSTVDVPSSKFTVESTTQGTIPFTRMTTTQRNGITPTEGLHIYNLTNHADEYWNGTVWKTIVTN